MNISKWIYVRSMTSWSTSRPVTAAATLGATMVRDRATNNGANSKSSLPLSEPLLETDMIDVSAAAVLPPCVREIHPSPEELPWCASFTGGGIGLCRDGNVWDELKNCCWGCPSPGKRCRVLARMGRSPITMSRPLSLSLSSSSSCGIIDND